MVNDILWLGPEREELFKWVEDKGYKIINTEEKLTKDSEILKDIDFVVSYGYRHIVKPEVIEMFTPKIINMHISLLPWNRGSDPNFWSWKEDTKKGVTIHQMDEGLDTGPILFQEHAYFSQGEHTLKSTYDCLSHTIECLFKFAYKDLFHCKIKPRPQDPNAGSHHFAKDKDLYMPLRLGWDTPVEEIIS